MPEINECRKCGDCCRCVFLEYDKMEDLFSCLIYKNKQRFPVVYTDRWMFDILMIAGFNYQMIANNYEVRIGKILRLNGTGTCHNYVCRSDCFTMDGKLRPERFKDRCERSRIDWRTWKWKAIKKMRRLIPDFNVLVEILNSTQPYPYLELLLERELEVGKRNDV